MSETIELKEQDFTNTNIFHEVSALSDYEKMRKMPVFRKIVLFNAPWLIPGRNLNDTLQEVFEDFKDKVLFVSVDIDSGTDIAIRENISNFPAVLFFIGDQLVDISYGAVTRTEIEDNINSMLG